MTAIRTFDPDSDMAALKVCLFGLQDFEVGLDPQSLEASVRFTIVSRFSQLRVLS